MQREYLDRSTDRVAGMVTTMDPSKDVEEVKQVGDLLWVFSFTAQR